MVYFVKKGSLSVTKRVQVPDNNYWPAYTKSSKCRIKQTIEKQYMKEIFHLHQTQYFGLNEILKDKKFSCEVTALEEDTILLTLNKTDIFQIFTPQEIDQLVEDTTFNVIFLEDIDLMNDVRSDILADKMKFNAVLFGGNIKMGNLTLLSDTPNMISWKKSLYLRGVRKIKSEE